MRLFEEFVKVAKKFSNHTAISVGDKKFSYADLEKRVEVCHKELGKAKIRPSDHVSVLLPNGVDFVVAVLASWKADAVVVPLHTKFQEREVLRYLNDNKVKFVLTDKSAMAAFTSCWEKCSDLSGVFIRAPEKEIWECKEKFKGSKTSAPSVSTATGASLEAPALIQYSTGSTGLSKKVVRTHRNLWDEFNAVSQVLGLNEKDRILGATPYFHSYGFLNAMLFGLLAGATLYPINDFFTRDVVGLIEREKITGLPGVPFMYQMLADFSDPADLSSFRYLLSAGAPLPEKTATAFLNKYGMAVRQLYGSTETGVISINSNVGNGSQALSVGYSIPGVSVEVLGDYNQKVPFGMDGHIAVRSPYAATSYDGLAGKGESYFANGLFFPGDMGRFHDDGRLILSGRKRMFINVAGNKVDPTEVEGVLKEHPAVTEAAVVGVPDGPSGEVIKAVLVTSAPCTRLEILSHCQKKLAEFKRPKIIEVRKEIQKSPLGKVLKKYLVGPVETIGEEKGTVAAAGLTLKPSFDLSLLPPALRMLVVSEGSLSKVLEAYFWEHLEAKPALQDVGSDGGGDIPQLNIQAGDPVIKTRVVFRGRESKMIYFLEDTFLVPQNPKEQIPTEQQIDVLEWMQAQRLEVHRDVISLGRQQSKEWKQNLGLDETDMVVVRKLLIFHEQKPMALVTQVFPEKYYHVRSQSKVA